MTNFLNIERAIDPSFDLIIMEASISGHTDKSQKITGNPYASAILFYRRQTELSQEDFARACGVGKNTIVAIETGKTRKPHPDTLKKLVMGLQALGIDIDFDGFDQKVSYFQVALEDEKSEKRLDDNGVAHAADHKEAIQGISGLINPARVALNNLRKTRGNTASQFIEGVSIVLNGIELMGERPSSRLNLESFFNLTRQLWRYAKEAQHYCYDSECTILFMSDTQKGLSDFIEAYRTKIDCNEDALIENDWMEGERDSSVAVLLEIIRKRQALLQKKPDLFPFPEELETAFDILIELEAELHQKNISLKILDGARRRLEILDRSIFRELLMNCHLLLGRYLTQLKTGMVFQDSEESPEMVILPKGTFMMGSSPNERARKKREGPQHEVKIDYTLAVGRYTVTFEQYTRFVQATGYTMPNTAHVFQGNRWVETPDRSYLNPGFKQNPFSPVVCVNIVDVSTYLKWLNQITGKAYRLLSEAEWEFAARAGKQTAYWWGDTIKPYQANYNNPCVRTMEVFSYKPNSWGLFNMHGNVWEWTDGHWHDDYRGAPKDGSLWVEGGDKNARALRGGAWNVSDRGLRLANRYKNQAAIRYDDTGFRVCQVL